MTRIAILGGGISGLTAAYELELARRRGAPIDWHLYEAGNRLGGIIETTRHTTSEGDFILEGGPDAWVTEKPWATNLAIELGLESELIYSNDTARKTCILQQKPGAAAKLQPIPDRMRLMVPEDLSTLEGSPLFSDSAKRAYAAELTRADELKHTAQLRDASSQPDESVAAFVLRHFGEEVLTTLAAPLLSGVFGGDVARLSVRAVMPQFVAMEREHGSLIAALQARSRERGNAPPQPIFTSLRNGMGSLIHVLVAQLPPERLHLNTPIIDIGDENRWFVTYDELKRADFRTPKPLYADHYDHVMLATPLDVTSDLLRLDGDPSLQMPLPTNASSAVLVTFIWSSETARTFAIPSGFGFLVPQNMNSKQQMNCHSERSEESAFSSDRHDQLLACTFVDQKFPHRCPPRARILRAFFGAPSAEALTSQTDESISATALTQLRAILGPIPEPSLTTIRRWPRSLPQYEVGHMDRMAQLDALVARIGNLTLLGNSYRGVGLPDLMRDARAAARSISAGIS